MADQSTALTVLGLSLKTCKCSWGGSCYCWRLFLYISTVLVVGQLHSLFEVPRLNAELKKTSLHTTLGLLKGSALLL